VVEIIVKKHGRCRYTTIQNWANNIYNLVTKRAVAREGAMMEWIDGNLGSRLTMKYPAVYMVEPGARGEILSIAFSSAGQHQDAGAKLVHAAPNTFGRIVSKSISKNGGRSSYRGLVRVEPGARKSRSSVVCDALILDDRSRSDTYPYIEIEEQDVSIGHEASVKEDRRGQHDDRQRVHRAAGEGTADGIRRRNEPADRAADGRLGRLTAGPQHGTPRSPTP
jgi:Fe-S cluster assembly protein SufB